MTTRYFSEKTLFSPLIHEPPPLDLKLVVTIPCHDEPLLLRTLDSLAACQPPRSPVEIIVLINASETAPEAIKKRNADALESARNWAAATAQKWLRCHVFNFSDLPAKHAGVGLARKIAMDEAARRLFAAGNSHGVIACLDADSLVKINYLRAIEDFFSEKKDIQTASIFYEHPLEGDDHAPEIFEAIARYELHLRCYVAALRWAGLAAAAQTIGSSMAVRADAYVAQGGMNRRQAGEDFYFLHKFTPLGVHGDILTTTVIPSPRVSGRVPFGTGRAVGDMLSGHAFSTYSPLIFKDLAVFLKKTDTFFSNPTSDVSELPASVRTFLEKENFEKKLLEIRSNTAGQEAFRKRFFRWFDPFLAMKFVHHARDNFYPNVAVEEAATWVLRQMGAADLPSDAKSLLLIFRELDRKLSR